MEAFESAVAYLKSKNIPEPDLSARYLLSSVVGIGYRYSDFEKYIRKGHMMTNAQLLDYESLIKRREAREPIQYLIGDWDFYGLTLHCESPVLIPRPETEELVEMVLSSVSSLTTSSSSSTSASTFVDTAKNSSQKPSIRFLDVGSGTGAIGIALLSRLKYAECVAIDINPTAVNLSNKNAAAHSLTDPIDTSESTVANLTSSSSLSQILSSTFRYKCLPTSFSEFVSLASQFTPPMTQTFDVIVSNPPYISSNEMLTLDPEVKDHEDPRALDGGTDGLNVIREIVANAHLLLRPDGPREVWLEVSSSHTSLIIENLVRDCVAVENIVQRDDQSTSTQLIDNKSKSTTDVNGVRVSVIKDLSGKNRFVHLRF